MAGADPRAAGAGSQSDSYSPGAIHMLRTVQTSSLRLAQMADQKASILMGASFVVFSIAVGQGLRGTLPGSLAVLALFSFLSALCGAMAVMPTVGRPGSGGRANKLFFGHFCDDDEEQWADELLGQMHSDEAVFRLMLRDIYQNGQVLRHRKYRFLTYAYRLFVAGLVATLTVAVIELAMGRSITS